jgi:formylglycine-generating enzyme required for sulfatase activity
MRVDLAILCTATGILLHIDTAAAERRVALVIGNGNYEHVARLTNPKNDAELIALTLRGLGFALVGGGAQIDLDKVALDRAVQTFSRQVQGADVALFYYAGHGVQVRGNNYLVPVGANPTREADVDFQMLDANVVLRQMEASGTKLNIVILDACRNNPFAGRGLRTAANGLAQMQAPEGTLISYATQPGNVALDGADGNSPYSRALAENMVRRGLDIFQTFNAVGLAVKNATGGSQQPWVSSSPISGAFYFAGPTKSPDVGTGPVQPAPSFDPAERAWAAIQNTTSIAVLESFVRQFGNTIYGDLARARVDELKRSQLAVGVSPLKIVVNVLPAERERALKPAEAFKECDVCPEMVVIPAGSFLMGSPDNEPERHKNEGPQRKVTIPKPFAVAKFEVTLDQFRAFVKDADYEAANRCSLRRGERWVEPSGLSWRAPSFHQGSNHPVLCVNWIDAKAYVSWLSRKTGKPYRLLSEAEWEYAARAGTITRFHFGNNQGDLCRFANVPDQTAKDNAPVAATWNIVACRDGHALTAPVGSFPANAFGLHDMYGNVWEWTEDCYNDSYAGAPSDGGAWKEGNCGRRLLRGGSYSRDHKDSRAAKRQPAPLGASGISFGIRVARTLHQ